MAISMSDSHYVNTHVATTSNHSNERNFNPDDRIGSESELDTETRALLYSLRSDDLPASYNPILEDSHNESFLALLRDAGPSPVKSVAGSVSYDKWGSSEHLEFRNDGDFLEYGLDTTFPMDFGMADFFRGVDAFDGPPTETIGRDLDLHSSDLPSCAAISEDEAVDRPPSLRDVHASQPNPTTIQEPLVAVKNSGVPRKRNSKGKLECTARGCTKFVLASKCKSQMCKGHCLTNGGCKDHGGSNGNPSLENSAPIAMASTDNNHWALSRPPSAFPLQPITSSATNNTISGNQTKEVDYNVQRHSRGGQL